MSKKTIRLLDHLNFMVPLGFALAIAATAGAGGTFDGTYKGSSLALPGSRPRCFNYNAVIVIQDDHFSRRLGDADQIINVAGDGTFYGEGSYWVGNHSHKVEPVSITGKITGENLEADIRSSRCTSHMSLKRS